MSLGVAIKGPEGIVLAADSRVTLEARAPNVLPLLVSFDNATKLLSFSKQRFAGAVTYGAALIGLRTAHSFVPEFDLKLPDEHLEVEEFAKGLSTFFEARWKESMPDDYPGPDMTFIVGGFGPGAAYGRVFLFSIPRNPQPVEQNPGEHNFGMTWGGQLQIATRIIHGYDPALPPTLAQAMGVSEDQLRQALTSLRQQLEFRIPYDVLPLQDCVNLAIFLIRATISAQALAVGVRGVGGPIDVAIITRTEGLKYVQQKKTRGELQHEG